MRKPVKKNEGEHKGREGGKDWEKERELAASWKEKKWEERYEKSENVKDENVPIVYIIYII